jgi:hypothetical protein
MRGGETDYRKVRPTECVTSAAGGETLSLNYVVHHVETSGSETVEKVSLGDGRWDGEIAIIDLIKLSTPSDTLRIFPASCPSPFEYITWPTAVAGNAVTLLWVESYEYWVIISGNGEPSWGPVILIDG